MALSFQETEAQQATSSKQESECEFSPSKPFKPSDSIQLAIKFKNIATTKESEYEYNYKWRGWPLKKGSGRAGSPSQEKETVSRAFDSDSAVSISEYRESYKWHGEGKPPQPETAILPRSPKTPPRVEDFRDANKCKKQEREAFGKKGRDSVYDSQLFPVYGGSRTGTSLYQDEFNIDGFEEGKPQEVEPVPANVVKKQQKGSDLFPNSKESQTPLSEYQNNYEWKHGKKEDAAPVVVEPPPPAVNVDIYEQLVQQRIAAANEPSIPEKITKPKAKKPYAPRKLDEVEYKVKNVPEAKPKVVFEAKPKNVCDSKSKEAPESKTKNVSETKPKIIPEANSKELCESKPKSAPEAKTKEVSSARKVVNKERKFEPHGTIENYKKVIETEKKPDHPRKTSSVSRKERKREMYLSQDLQTKASVRIHNPNFYTNPRTVPIDEREKLVGPVWVYWPKGKPLPSTYKNLANYLP